MLIAPNPGVALSTVREVLATSASEAQNLHSWSGGEHTQGPGSSAHKLWAYLEWVRKTARVLSSVISATDTAQLLDWAGYENLMAMAPAWAASVGGNPQERILHDLLSHEITNRADVLATAAKNVQDQMSTWAAGFAKTVVFDTSVYLSYRDMLHEIAWTELVGPEHAIRLVVPMVVIDELDATKSDQLRGRAAYTLAVLDKALRGTGQLSEAPVQVEIKLFSDPLGHQRLPINDQEIIVRSLAVQAVAQSPVTLLTCDTGMALRAREAGLNERLLERTDPKGGKPKSRTPGQTL